MSKGEVEGQQIRECFTLPSDYSQNGTLRRGCMQAQTKDGSKSRRLGEGEKLNKSLVIKHFVLIDLQGPNHSSDHLQGKERDFGEWASGPVRGKQGNHLQSYLSHIGRGGFLQQHFSSTQRDEGIAYPLLLSRIPGLRYN